jgi:hypothetical protein
LRLAWIALHIGLSSLSRHAGAAGEERSEGGLVLNEILASNRTGLLDEDGRSSDWIELENRGKEPVDLAGFKLSDDPGAGPKWTFPAVVIQPGGHLVVWASGKDRYTLPQKTLSKAKNGIEFERTFIRAGDAWRYMLPEAGREGPQEGWTGASFDDSSWAEGPSGFGYEDDDDATLLPEGTTSIYIRREFRVTDPAHVGQLVLKVDYDDGFVAYLNGVRVASVNSPVPDPSFSTIASNKHEPGAAESFDLSPHVASLRPGKNVLAIVGLNDKPSTDMSLIPQLGTMPMICHTSFELDADGGEVFLMDPQGRELDHVRYPRQAEDRSYGRSRQAAGGWGYFATPSPGAENRFRLFSESPSVTLTFAPPPGYYREAVQVALKAESSVKDLEVRYTTDGAPPTGGSELAEGPVRVTRSTVFRVAAFAGEERISPVVSASYFLDSPAPLPALSLSMDPGEFAEVHLKQSAHGRTAERGAYLEVFGASGERLVATAMGLRLHGGYGRKGDITTKKSYKAYFRRCLGDSSLKCSLIPGLSAGALDELVLRAGFNDRLGAYHPGACFLRDQVLRDIHRDMGALISAGSWCLLYVNMMPKGLYNVVERIDEQFLTRHLGGKQWDLVKTGNVVVSGTREAWDALAKLLKQKDLTPKDLYDAVQGRVDLESFTSYMILNLWSQNEDWPQNNWYAARERREGSKWVFLSWDNEWGMGLTPPGYQADSYAVLLAKKGQIRDLFFALLTSEEYRKYFLREVERHLVGALSPERVEKHIEEEVKAVNAVIPAELRRNAPAFSTAVWRQNVETLRRFAAARGSFFRELSAWKLGEKAARSPAPTKDGSR